MKSPINSKPGAEKAKRGARAFAAPTAAQPSCINPVAVATARSLPFSHKRWFVANPNVPDSALND